MPATIEVELRLIHLVDMRVEHILAIDVADACAADRAHERYARKGQRRRGGDNRDNIRIVLQIMLHDGDDNLRVVLVAICKERADRAVDEAGNQRFLLGRTAFTLEVAARDLAGGESLFLIVDGQREEIETNLRLLGRDDRGEHDGLAIGGEHCAICLTGDLAGFQDERTAAPLDFHFVVIEHVLSFVCGRSAPAIPARLPFLGFVRTSHGQDNGKLGGLDAVDRISSVLQSCPMTCS